MPILKDDYTLLRIMLDDANGQSGLYRPGPYWLNKTKVASKQILKYGIGDFRGSSSSIGLSFTDSLYIDTRKNYQQSSINKTFQFILEKIFPFNKAFNAQVKITKSYADEMLIYKNESIKKKPRTIQILSKYKVPFSLLGGCVDCIDIDEGKVSSHYLNLLEQLDRVAEKINLNSANSYFEIGGGFGVNVHLILENFCSIKKIIYLDIPPNLYIGTQYLKAFYGDAVKDYSQTRSLREIKFKNDDSLEIFTIAPWQIEKVKTEVDVFWNAHSFVEMPEPIVKNYAQFINDLLSHDASSIVLISYDNFDSKSTLDPDTLQTYFDNRCFESFSSASLLNNDRCNKYFIFNKRGFK